MLVMASQSLMTSIPLGADYPLLGGLSGLLAAVSLLILLVSLRRQHRVAALLPWIPRKRWLAVLVIAARTAIPVLLVVASMGLYFSRIDYVEANVTNVEDYASKLPVQFIILVDVSKSMLRADTGVPRIEAAKTFLEEFLGRLTPRDRVVLAVFSSNTTLLCEGSPLNCTSVVGGLRAGERYSAIGNAVSFAVSLARASGLPSVVVVVSDMANNYGAPPLDVLREAKTPVLLVKVGNDPRASWIYRAARENSMVKVFSLVTGSLDEAKNLARGSVDESRLTAYRGRTVIPVEHRDYFPTMFSLLAATLLIAIDLALTPSNPLRGTRGEALNAV